MAHFFIAARRFDRGGRQRQRRSQRQRRRSQYPAELRLLARAAPNPREVLMPRWVL